MPYQRAAVFLIVPVLLMSLVDARPRPTGAAQARNVALVGHLDIEGGGMVDVQGDLAVIGHMQPPHATSILDVSRPATSNRPSMSNDVFVDARGIYLIDRDNGLDILRFAGRADR